MKRLAIALVACAVISLLPGSGAAGPRLSGQAYQGAGSIRVIGDRNSLTIQAVSGAKWFDENDASMRTGAGYLEIRCKRVNRRLFRCFIRPGDYVRFRDVEFDIDPALDSAHLSASSSKGKVDLTWTGHGDHDPGIGQSVYENLSLLRGGQVFGSAGASVDRRARLSGKLFGGGFRGSSSGVYEGAYVFGRACISFGLRCFTKRFNLSVADLRRAGWQARPHR